MRGKYAPHPSHGSGEQYNSGSDAVRKESTINFNARQLNRRVNIISGFQSLPCYLIRCYLAPVRCLRVCITNEAKTQTPRHIYIAFQSHHNKFVPIDLMIRLLIVMRIYRLA